jgi:hypothetical protein
VKSQSDKQLGDKSWIFVLFFAVIPWVAWAFAFETLENQLIDAKVEQLSDRGGGRSSLNQNLNEISILLQMRWPTSFVAALISLVVLGGGWRRGAFQRFFVKRSLAKSENQLQPTIVNRKSMTVVDKFVSVVALLLVVGGVGWAAFLQLQTLSAEARERKLSNAGTTSTYHPAGSAQAVTNGYSGGVIITRRSAGGVKAESIARDFAIHSRFQRDAQIPIALAVAAIGASILIVTTVMRCRRKTVAEESTSL